MLIQAVVHPVYFPSSCVFFRTETTFSGVAVPNVMLLVIMSLFLAFPCVEFTVGMTTFEWWSCVLSEWTLLAVIEDIVSFIVLFVEIFFGFARLIFVVRGFEAFDAMSFFMPIIDLLLATIESWILQRIQTHYKNLD